MQTKILNIILNFAESDENIRAVLLEGSRANPNGKVDDLSDYDIAFVTARNTPYLSQQWFNDFAIKFGKVIISQTPDNPELWSDAHDPQEHYTYLALFDDGLRIDMTFGTAQFMDKVTLDSATIVLLDKDNKFPNVVLNNNDFLIKAFTRNQFKACCNEFWWCLQNVAKGIARDELPYVMKMFGICHDELDEMAKYHIGIQNKFAVSSGKFGKYFKQYLSEGIYKMYEKTYSDSNYKHLWNAVFVMCDLFRILAKEVAKERGFSYNQSEDEGMMRYLTKIKNRRLKL